MDELVAATRQRAIDLHGYTEEEINSETKVEEWKGAIKQSSRPGGLRTPHPEDDRIIEPHQAFLMTSPPGMSWQANDTLVISSCRHRGALDTEQLRFLRQCAVSAVLT